MSTEARTVDVDVDPELARGPAPPRTMRAVAVALMGLTGLLAAWLAIALAPEAVYTMAGGKPVDLGDFATSDIAPDLANRHVRAHVVLDRSTPPVRFRRLLDPDSFEAVAAGKGRWVVYRVPTSVDGPRFVAPTLIAGRLVPVDSLGPRFRGLPGALGSGWVLLDGEDPASVSWIAGLELLLLSFVAWSTWSIARVLRRSR